MYLKITNNILTKIIAIGLVLFTLLPDFVNYSIFKLTVNVMELALVLLVITSTGYLRFDFKVIPVAILLAIFLRNNLFNLYGNISFNVFIICLIMIILSIYGNGNWIETYLYGALILAMVHALCTIGFRFAPGFYISYILPLYPATRSRLLTWYVNNCMPGLAIHYSTNGMYLVVGLFSSIFFMFKSKSKTIFKIAITGIFLIAVLLTGKRAHLIFSLIALYLAYYFYLSNDKRTRGIKILGVTLAIATLGIIVLTYVPSLATAFIRIKESLDEGDVTANRGNFWNLAIDLFKANPILGVGWGQFLVYSEKVLHYSAYAHNNYLQLLCETGLVGTITYLAWMVVSLYRSIRQYIFIRENQIDNKLASISVFSMLMQIFFMLYCFTGNPFYDLQMFIPYFMACAIVWYLDNILKNGSYDLK